MQDVPDEPLFAERVAGLDIAKAEVLVTIQVPGDTAPGRRQQETRTFATTRAEQESLGDWLACWGVTKIGMEATGDYWKPVFFLLESRGSTAICTTPRRSRPCPAGPRPTGPTRSGWPGSPGGARCPPASCRPSPSAACAPTPATAATSPRPTSKNRRQPRRARTRHTAVCLITVRAHSAAHGQCGCPGIWAREP